MPPEDEPIWGRPEKAQEEGPAVSFGLFGIEAASIEAFFPGSTNETPMIADWDPPPGVLDYAALADDVSAPEAAEIYDDLLDQTKAIDPAYNKAARLPKGAFSRLSRADRHRLIDDVLMDRAAADYNVRGDPRKLQIETVKFLRKAVDHYYAEAVKEVDAKPFQPRPSREIAIGKNVDSETRQDLKRLFDRKGIPYGPGKRVAINNRDYTDQNGKAPYRVPDLRIGEVKVGNLTIDWTIRIKQPEDSQIWDFVHAKSQPKGVIIVIPSQRFPPGARYIPRAAVLKGIGLCLSHIHF